MEETSPLEPTVVALKSDPVHHTRRRKTPPAPIAYTVLKKHESTDVDSETDDVHLGVAFSEGVSVIENVQDILDAHVHTLTVQPLKPDSPIKNTTTAHLGGEQDNGIRRTDGFKKAIAQHCKDKLLPRLKRTASLILGDKDASIQDGDHGNHSSGGQSGTKHAHPQSPKSPFGGLMGSETTAKTSNTQTRARAYTATRFDPKLIVLQDGSHSLEQSTTVAPRFARQASLPGEKTNMEQRKSEPSPYLAHKVVANQPRSQSLSNSPLSSLPLTHEARSDSTSRRPVSTSAVPLTRPASNPQLPQVARAAEEGSPATRFSFAPPSKPSRLSGEALDGRPLGALSPTEQGGDPTHYHLRKSSAHSTDRLSGQISPVRTQQDTSSNPIDMLQPSTCAAEKRLSSHLTQGATSKCHSSATNVPQVRKSASAVEKTAMSVMHAATSTPATQTEIQCRGALPRDFFSFLTANDTTRQADVGVLRDCATAQSELQSGLTKGHAESRPGTTVQRRGSGAAQAKLRIQAQAQTGPETPATPTSTHPLHTPTASPRKLSLGVVAGYTIQGSADQKQDKKPLLRDPRRRSSQSAQLLDRHHDSSTPRPLSFLSSTTHTPGGSVTINSHAEVLIEIPSLYVGSYKPPRRRKNSGSSRSESSSSCSDGDDQESERSGNESETVDKAYKQRATAPIWPNERADTFALRPPSVGGRRGSPGIAGVLGFLTAQTPPANIASAPLQNNNEQVGPHSGIADNVSPPAVQEKAGGFFAQSTSGFFMFNPLDRSDSIGSNHAQGDRQIMFGEMEIRSDDVNQQGKSITIKDATLGFIARIGGREDGRRISLDDRDTERSISPQRSIASRETTSITIDSQSLITTAFNEQHKESSSIAQLQCRASSVINTPVRPSIPANHQSASRTNNCQSDGAHAPLTPGAASHSGNGSSAPSLPLIGRSKTQRPRSCTSSGANSMLAGPAKKNSAGEDMPSLPSSPIAGAANAEKRNRSRAMTNGDHDSLPPTHFSTVPHVVSSAGLVAHAAKEAARASAEARRASTNAISAVTLATAPRTVTPPTLVPLRTRAMTTSRKEEALLIAPSRPAAVSVSTTQAMMPQLSATARDRELNSAMGFASTGEEEEKGTKPSRSRSVSLVDSFRVSPGKLKEQFVKPKPNLDLRRIPKKDDVGSGLDGANQPKDTISMSMGSNVSPPSSAPPMSPTVVRFVDRVEPPPTFVEQLLNDTELWRDLKLSFFRFLDEEHSRESVLYYYKCLKFRKRVECNTATYDDIQELFKEFIDADAKYEVNIPASIKRRIVGGVTKLTPESTDFVDVADAFEAAKESLVTLLQQDTYKRFLKKLQAIQPTRSTPTPV